MRRVETLVIESMPRYFGIACAIFVSQIATADTFHYGWTAPSQAKVTCSRTDRGITAHARWNLSVEADGSTDNYVLRMFDYELLDVEGLSSDQVEEMKANPLFVASQSLIPSWKVGPDGQLISTSPMQPVIDTMISEIDDQDVAKQLKAYFQSPAIMEALRARAASYWDIWVGTFVGLEIGPNETQDFTVPVTLGDVEFLSTIRVEHLGILQNSKEVHLRVTSTYEGPEFKSYMKSMVLEMISQTGITPDQKDFVLESARKTTVINVVTDPMTLYPSKVNLTEEDAIKVKGEPLGERVKINNCSFGWKWKAE